ncbi:MAG: hypothetical protein R3B67_08735 [Phycisphaerales bacterium]
MNPVSSPAIAANETVTRSTLAQRAADALEAICPETTRTLRSLVGFDGFVDSIIHVVDQRHSMQHDDYKRIRTIPEFAARCGAAANRSANIELVVTDTRYGGNGPLLSSALGSLGSPVVYVGAVATEDDWTKVDPIYQPFVDKCEKVVPLCPPGRTDALEFDDGKIMLGKPESVQLATWDRIKEVVGLEQLIAMIDEVKLISVVNWTLVGGVEGIWDGLCADVFPKLSKANNRRIFIDLSDPAKRTDEDIVRAMGKIQQLQQHMPVTLGLNLAESGRVARVIGVEAYDDEHNRTLAGMVPEAAEHIRASSGSIAWSFTSTPRRRRERCWRIALVHRAVHTQAAHLDGGGRSLRRRLQLRADGRAGTGRIAGGRVRRGGRVCA